MHSLRRIERRDQLGLEALQRSAHTPRHELVSCALPYRGTVAAPDRALSAKPVALWLLLGSAAGPQLDCAAQPA
jgi:hypothetical protein